MHQAGREGLVGALKDLHCPRLLVVGLRLDLRQRIVDPGQMTGGTSSEQSTIRSIKLLQRLNDLLSIQALRRKIRLFAVAARHVPMAQQKAQVA